MMKIIMSFVVICTVQCERDGWQFLEMSLLNITVKFFIIFIVAPCILKFT